MKLGIRELAFLLLLVAMPVLAWFFVFEPRNEQIAEARAEIREKKAKLVQLRAATASIENLGEEIDRLAAAIEMFQKKLPEQREVEVVLKNVWELASRNDLLPKSVKTDKPVTERNYTNQPIRMEIVGEFDGFYSFLLELERMNRITRLPTMKLEKARSEDGQMKAAVILNVFFEPKSEPKEV